MADLNNNAPVDTLELDPADGQQYILELRDRMLELLLPAQSILEVEERLKKLYPDSKLIDLAISEAKKPRGESSHKNHKVGKHSTSSSASFTGTLHNITSMAVAKVSKLVRDGVVGNKSENELSKYKIALIQFIINDVLKLAENFVKRQKGNFIITRSDIRTAMHADKDLLDMFLSDDKNFMITENHPILASINNIGNTCQHVDGASKCLTTYRQKVMSMADSENSFINRLNILIKVFKCQLNGMHHYRSEVQALFCNIEELHELALLLVCDLEDALESVGQSNDEVPFVGLEILDLAQAEEFHAYFTFAYKRLSRDELWRPAYSRLVSSESIMASIRKSDSDLDFAIRHLLPSYLLNVIVHFFEFFTNISDLYELSKQHSNKEDQFALKETISILIKTKKAIEELIENEMGNEEMEPLDLKQAQSVEEALRRKLHTELRNERNAPLLFMPPPEMYRFSEPDSRENIQFEDFQNRTISSKDLDVKNHDETNLIPVIRCATLIKLVERVTYHNLTPNIVDTFLTTYRSFIPEPEELLDLLIERFKVPDPPLGVVVPSFHDSPDRLPECERRAYKIYIHHFRQNYSKPVKMRVINLLKSWIRNHYYDFESHPVLLQKLNAFLDEVHENERILRAQIVSIKKSLDQKRLTKYEDKLPSYMLGERPDILWLSDQAVDPTKFDLLNLHPVEFARQLTLIEFDLFRAIKPSELINVRDLGLRSRKDDNLNSSPNLSRLTRHFTLFSYWIRKCIVDTKELDKRALVYCRSIEIMAVLRDLNNHTGLLSIGSAIESAPIRRLTHTQKALSNTAMKVLEDYRELTEDHQKKLQYRLKQCNPPCIPYLGSYQTKLIHAKEGNKTFMDEIDTSTISPTLSTDEFHSSFSNSPATPISPRTPLPRSTFMHVGSPNPPLSATSTLQNQFFGSPTSMQQQQPPQPKMINFHKQRIRAGLVAEISNYQNQPYCLKPETNIQRFIESIEDEMRNFAISLDKRPADDNYWKEPSVPAMTKLLDDYLFEESVKIEPKNFKPPRLKKLPDFWQSKGVKIH